VNLVRTVPLRSFFAAVDAILGAIVTSHTHQNVMIHPKYGKYSSIFSLCRLRSTTELRSGTVDLKNASSNPSHHVPLCSRKTTKYHSIKCLEN